MPVTRRTVTPSTTTTTEAPEGAVGATRAHLARRSALAALALAGTGALAACSGSTQDPTPTPSPDAATTLASDAPPSASAEPSAPASSPADAEEQEEPEDSTWTSGDSSVEPEEGSRLFPSGFRMMAHPEDGYDRVVVELVGPGTPGWNAMWVDQAFTQGKGDPIELEGSHTLVVYGTGSIMLLPEEAPGALERGVRERLSDGAGIIDADLQLPFESQYQLTLGTGTQEYRVFSLTEPTRLVVDVRRPEQAGLPQ